jgi:hypothetical protein
MATYKTHEHCVYPLIRAIFTHAQKKTCILAHMYTSIHECTCLFPRAIGASAEIPEACLFIFHGSEAGCACMESAEEGLLVPLAGVRSDSEAGINVFRKRADPGLFMLLALLDCSEAVVNVFRKRADPGLFMLLALLDCSEAVVNVFRKCAEAGLCITPTGAASSGAGVNLFSASAELGLLIPVETSEAGLGGCLESGEAGLILIGSLFLSCIRPDEGLLPGGDALIGWLPK